MSTRATLLGHLVVIIGYPHQGKGRQRAGILAVLCGCLIESHCDAHSSTRPALPITLIPPSTALSLSFHLTSATIAVDMTCRHNRRVLF